MSDGRPAAVGDGAGHLFRLLAVLLEAPEAHPRAGAAVRAQRLRAAAAVVRDEGRGGLEDARRRAVVALERDDPRAGKVRVEAEDVLDLRPPPAVDRLVLVPDRAERVGRLAEQPDQRVLRAVGVLVLVDEQVPDAPPLGGEQRRVLAQQAHGPDDQVVEVEGARGRRAACRRAGRPARSARPRSRSATPRTPAASRARSWPGRSGRAPRRA